MSRRDDDDEKRTIELTEGQVVRWLCYLGFFFCLISLVTSLSTGGPWVGFLLGAVGFGYPAIKFYVQHEDMTKAEGNAAKYQAARKGGQREWDMGSDGDPTDPNS